MLRRRIAKLLGIKPEKPVLHITVPPGAVLIMPKGSEIDTVNCVDGKIYYASTADQAAKIVISNAEVIGGTVDFSSCRPPVVSGRPYLEPEGIR